MTLYKAVRPDGTDFYTGTVRWLPENLTVPDGGWLVEHPQPADRIGRKSGADASGYLSLATTPTDCTGFRWPCLLLAVEPVGRPCLDDHYPNKRRVRAARVVAILPAHEAMGPQGEHVAALTERARTLTLDEAQPLDAAGAVACPARAAARAAAWAAARDGARAAARDAAWAAAWAAARGGAWAAAWAAARGGAWAAAWAAARDGAWAAARDAEWAAAWAAARDGAWAAARDAAWAIVVRDLISRNNYDTLTLPWRQTVGRIHPDDEEVTR